MASEARSGELSQRSALFACLLAVAAFAYQAQLRDPLGSNLPTLTLICAIAVLVRPTSFGRLVVFLAAQLAAVWAQLPVANTNRMLGLFVALTVIVMAPAGWLAARRGTARDALEPSVPLLRLTLLVVYFFSFFHKLNSGFLDPATSCGVAIYRQVADGLAPLPLPDAESMAGLTIIGVLALEALLPLLLVLRRTRHLAVAGGMVFHFGLGFGGFYSFSATMMALLFLFVPASACEGPSVRTALRVARWLGVALLAVVVVSAIVFAWSPTADSWDDVDAVWQGLEENILWWWLALVPVAALARRIFRVPATADGRRLVFAGARFGLVLPLLVVLNGLCPYLGLKTEYCFAMYSNLRTEGGVSNHLLIATPPYIADYQADLVRIVDSSDRWLAGNARSGTPIPWLLARQRIKVLADAGRRDIAVTYERGGVLRSVSAAEEDPELTEPVSYLEHKLLMFRTIRPADANTCAH